MTMIADNLQRIHDRITQTCDKAGRSPDSVALLAVSKTFGAEAVAQAHAAGQTAFGENYIQEAVEKITALAHLPLQWHCIGPIQSNKTRLVAEHFDWVQTIDRLKIAQRLSEQRRPIWRRCRCVFKSTWMVARPSRVSRPRTRWNWRVQFPNCLACMCGESCAFPSLLLIL
jgi:pyridoxal phosphate enzyme (YggS family)